MNIERLFDALTIVGLLFGGALWLVFTLWFYNKTMQEDSWRWWVPYILWMFVSLTVFVYLILGEFPL